MTTLQDLITLVENNPYNPICGGMLADELMEVKDLTRAQADVQVEKVQEVAITAAFMRRAAGVLSGCPWQRAWSRDRVLEAVGAPEDTTAVLMLVPGLQYPKVHVPTSMEVGAIWREGTITVGAEWLLREYGAYLAMMRTHKRELREAKKKK